MWHENLDQVHDKHLLFGSIDSQITISAIYTTMHHTKTGLILKHLKSFLVGINNILTLPESMVSIHCNIFTKF